MAVAIRSIGQPHETPIRLVRPRGVGVVAAIDTAMGGLSVLGGLSSVTTGWTPLTTPTGLGFLQPLAPELPALLFGIGAILLVQGYGLWRGLAWAWTLAVVFETIHVVADIGFIASRSFAVDKFVGLAIILGSLAYLTRPGVRAYFGKVGVRAALLTDVRFVRHHAQAIILSAGGRGTRGI